MNIDPTVKKETLFVGVVTLILSMLMQSVFLIIGRWDLSVLLGNLLGAVIGILNFFFLGLSVQKAVSSGEKKAERILCFMFMSATRVGLQGVRLLSKMMQNVMIMNVSWSYLSCFLR